MAIVLQVDNLTKSYGDRLLFGEISFGVEDGDKIGIIAKNGTGKSTLLRILSGSEECDSGKVVFRNNLRIGYLEQSPRFDDGSTPRCFIENFSTHGGHDDEDARMALVRLITQIGDGIDLDTPFGNLSGGQRKRVALAAALADNPDLLILDEPTNHLDIHTIEWLEGYLRRSRLALLLVTHDRYFLDRVCNRIVEIDREQIYTYPGNYSRYLEMRAARIEAMTAQLAKIKNTLRKEQEWMSRQPQARAGKAKYRIDAFHDLKERSRMNLAERNVDLNAKAAYIGKKIFSAENVSKSFGTKCVLRDFSYEFARYEKIGIVGDNGVGKTTFVKMLQGLVSPDSGRFDIGQTVRFGYYGQERTSLPPGKKVIDAITDLAEEINPGNGGKLSALQYLQRFLFDAKDQQKYIGNLSGGELARLHLAIVLMSQPNFLILDEPTNDLDIVTLGILEEFLSGFDGCVIVISHDRYFLDNTVDRIFVMEGDGAVRDYPGNYTDYLEAQKQAEGARQSDGPNTKNRETRNERQSERHKNRENSVQKLTFKEKREFEQLTVEIEQLTARREELENMLSSGMGSHEEITDAALAYREVRDLLDEKEMRWLELSEKT